MKHQLVALVHSSFISCHGESMHGSRRSSPQAEQGCVGRLDNKFRELREMMHQLSEKVAVQRFGGGVGVGWGGWTHRVGWGGVGFE